MRAEDCPQARDLGYPDSSVQGSHLLVALAHEPVLGRDVPDGDHAHDLASLHHGQVPEVAFEPHLKGIGRGFIEVDRLWVWRHHGPDQGKLPVQHDGDDLDNHVALADDADEGVALHDSERADVMLAQPPAHLAARWDERARSAQASSVISAEPRVRLQPARLAVAGLFVLPHYLGHVLVKGRPMQILQTHASRWFVSTAAAVLLSASVASSASAQGTPPATQSSAAPDAATLKAAREVVSQMQGDRTNTLNSMSGPMVGMMQQMGIKEQDRAQVLVQEVVLPMLTARFDDLLDIQARSFAGVLSKEDLQAIGAFYATPAGKRLAAAQPQLAQAQLTGTTQWMGQMMPEMQAKLAQAIKTHGWGPGGKAK